MNPRHVLIAVSLAACSSVACAEGNQLYFKGGTMGLGVGYATSFTDTLGGRIGANYFSFSRDDTYESNRYSADIKFSSIEALADVYLAGGFRLTGGAIYNANKIDLTAKLGTGGTFTVNGTTYAGINSASAEIDLGRRRLAPYIGVGYSSRPKSGGGLGFYFDAGVVHQTPRATITVQADPAITNDPTFQANKAQEENKLRDSISGAANWPVLMFGMSYTF